MSAIGRIRAPLFVPADKPGWIEKALASGADAVILDLEDAVAAENKAAARRLLRVDPGPVPFVVRINGTRSAWHEADLAAISGHRFAAVMLPLAESPGELAALADALPQMPLIALIESARGLAAARAIAATTGVARLAFGSVDYCADLGCAHVPEALLAARSEIIVASRLAGLPAPIDGVTTAFYDSEMLKSDAACARDLGMGGKLCIHPGQPPHVKACFAPTEGEIAWARAVLSTGDGAASLDGELVDQPIRTRAYRILEDVKADPDPEASLENDLP
ncbi:HpcH/HpaI aldolase/citrate lyase family protein [Nitratireductor pacificus]|uniref:HpcH/HpaI aldolase n=1 Tax=Nitratireductor pacificus pht-3B TaxID=391937 RepID=K2ME59_9HYPH|nr:CoA ester lyase [Nitratireductor pacificus]EKF20466.1 HpcH/HpaI aldolase [Nitratireductor pacificus pht-3B]